jgi:tRNA modification GTPase
VLIDADELAFRLQRIERELDTLMTQMASRQRADGDLPRIVLYGQPNVGKSTLWNALVGREVAIVAETPGTTRDYLEATVDLDGQRCVLVDTAGIDQTLIGAVDSAAQALSSRTWQQGDLRVLCLEAGRPLSAWERQALAGEPSPDLTIWNKCDLEDPVGENLASFRGELHRVSARTGRGLAPLRQRLAASLGTPDVTASAMIATTALRCRQSIEHAHDAVERAHELAACNGGQELIAAELRVALAAVGQTVGAVYTDDILDRIFSRFCIGK